MIETDLTSDLYGVDFYDSLKDYLKENNMELQEFKDRQEQGWLLNITCGLYNGASDIFTPWELTTKNVNDTIKNDISESNFSEGVYCDDLKEPSLKEQIEDYKAMYDVFTIKDSKQIYVDMS